MTEAYEALKAAPNNDSSQTVDTIEGLSHLPLLSVVSDAEGIEAVRVWTIGNSSSHWLADTGAEYELVLPVTVLSIPKRVPASR